MTTELHGRIESIKEEEDKNTNDAFCLCNTLAAGLIGLLAAYGFSRKKNVNEVKEREYGVKLDGLAMGTINVHVDPVKHPFLTLLGNAIHLLNKSHQKRRKNMNKNMILGGVAGGLIGITTALLLAPKSGNKLLQELYNPIKPVLGGLALGKKTGQKNGPAKSHATHAKLEAGHSSKAKKTSSSTTAAKKRTAPKRAAAKKSTGSSSEQAS